MQSCTEQDIEGRLKDIIVQEFMDGRSGITLENDLLLIEEEIIDSLGIFVLISLIEDNFHVKVNPEEVVLENFETVNTIKSLVCSKLSSKEGVTRDEYTSAL